MNNLDLENQLIEKLSIVRDEFIANREELAVSIRKDVVAAQLRDILINNLDFYELKAAIEAHFSIISSFISLLLSIDNTTWLP